MLWVDVCLLNGVMSVSGAAVADVLLEVNDL